MHDEDDLLPISALQHWLFCRRQCGLIHLEQVWSENRLTAQGRRLHDRAHQGEPESRGDLRVVRGLRLCGLHIGLTGQADVVELRRPAPDTPAETATTLPSLDGRWTLQPVEYKRGRAKQNDCDRVQLCAQAICLEEMLSVAIPAGSLYYGQPRRREPVAFTAALRGKTAAAAEGVRAMLAAGVTPPPEPGRKCRSCSLNAQCMPKRAGPDRRVILYIRRNIQASLDDPHPQEPGP